MFVGSLVKGCLHSVVSVLLVRSDNLHCLVLRLVIALKGRSHHCYQSKRYVHASVGVGDALGSAMQEFMQIGLCAFYMSVSASVAPLTSQAGQRESGLHVEIMC